MAWLCDAWYEDFAHKNTPYNFLTAELSDVFWLLFFFHYEIYYNEVWFIYLNCNSLFIMMFFRFIDFHMQSIISVIQHLGIFRRRGLPRS